MAARNRMALQVGVAVVAVAAVVLGTKLVMNWPLERAVYLAPVLVVCVAAAVGLLLLWGRIAYQSLRESRRPRLVISLWIAGLALIALLTVLGVKLPRE
jgi:hypothetical protein